MFNRSVNHAICSELVSFNNLTELIFIEEIQLTGMIKLLHRKMCISL